LIEFRLLCSDDDFDGVSTYTGGGDEDEDEATHNVCYSSVNNNTDN